MITKLIKVIITFVIYSLFHDVLIKKIYCRWKKVHQTDRRCYFWNCTEWNSCPYNKCRDRKSKR